MGRGGEGEEEMFGDGGEANLGDRSVQAAPPDLAGG